MPVIDVKGLIQERADAIARFHRGLSVERAQLDVSGGVDSAVMLGLLAQALGSEAITAAYSNIHSSPESKARAEAVAARFGVRLVTIDLTPIFETLVASMTRALETAGYDAAALRARIDADATILGSIRSTLRAPVGRGFNRLSGGGIRHGTGNECEDRYLRFFQKGGDGEVDTNPIAMLSKGEVYQVGVGLGVPREVLDAVPSPDLWGIGEAHSDEAHGDEAELRKWTGAPFTYSRVDAEGRYTRVGSIERVSRFLDEVDDRLFTVDDEAGLDEVLRAAHDSPALRALPAAEIDALCRAARRVERITRHKENPSATPLGDRVSLVNAGLVSDTLP